MATLPDALLTLIMRCGTAEIAEQVAVPKRTMDRWVAALRSGDITDWPVHIVQRIAQYEAECVGTTTVADAFRPRANFNESGTRIRTTTNEIARIMSDIVHGHRHADELIAEMAMDMADGAIDSSEARRMVPLVDVVLEHGAKQAKELGKLRLALIRQIATPS